MYSISNSQITDLKDLNTFISDEEILLKYFGEYELDKHYLCPFVEETVPSFIISYYNNRLVWRRFGLYDRPMSAIDFVMVKFNLSFKDAINKCFREINVDNTEILKTITIPVETSKTCGINYVEDWYPWELDYWKDYHFDKKILKKYEIYPCTGYWINQFRWHYSKKNDPLFVYMHGLNSWTGYRPLAKNKLDKFRKHNIKNHIMGMENLPNEGDLLFITKSYKDLITLNLIGLNAIAVHTERVYIDHNIITNLKKRFKHIYVVFDNDKTGIDASMFFTKEYGLNYYNIPSNCIGCKDPADLSKIQGLDALEKSIKEKLKRDNIL